MKLAIGLPIQDNVPGEAFGWHVSAVVEAVKYMEKAGGEAITIFPVGISPHDAARDAIVTAAIKAECNRLFFIDDDTITPRGGFAELMRVMDEKACAAVSGFYLRRGNPYTPVWSCERDGEWFNVDANAGVHEIHMTGLGCCLLDLDWLVANVPQPWFKMKQGARSTIITDDITLFEAIRKSNGKIYGDASVQCPHIGRREFICRETGDALRNVHSALINAKVINPTAMTAVGETK